jgi:predicted nucleic acid-binding protein
MMDLVLDSSVVAKCVLPEHDSDKAITLLETATRGDRRLFVLDLALPEVSNAIWQWRRLNRVSGDLALACMKDLLSCRVEIQSSIELLESAMEIAVRYERTVYDALFVALSNSRQLTALTADEPLFNAVHRDYPRVALFRDWQDAT